MNTEPNQKETFHLYSQRAISIATYIGGPLAAGILARQNFINLGKEELGKKALIISIVSTILLFVVIFSIPENLIDKIPSAVIPLVYTAIIYLIIEKTQGVEIKEHKSNNHPFYSAWKAVGIGAISSVILLIGIFGYAYLAPYPPYFEKYDEGIEKFAENEDKALHLFSIIETSSPNEIIEYIDNIGLPAWKENLVLINDLDNIEGIDEDLINQNKILKQYSNLNIEAFELIKKAFEEDTDKYAMEIDELNRKIEKKLSEL